MTTQTGDPNNSEGNIKIHKSKKVNPDKALEEFVILWDKIDAAKSSLNRNRNNSEFSIKAITSLRFALQISQNKLNPEALEKLFEQNMKSKEPSERTLFIKTLKDNPTALSHIFSEERNSREPTLLPDSDSDSDSDSKQKTIKKCQALIKEAKEYWESEFIKIIKSKFKEQKSIKHINLYHFKNFVVTTQTDDSNKSGKSEGNIKVYISETSLDKAPKELVILWAKIAAAKKLLSRNHNSLESFKKMFKEKTPMVTRDRSPLIQRIFRTIAKILAPPIAIIHTAYNDGTLIWKPRGHNLVKDVNRKIREAERKNTACKPPSYVRSR